MSTKESPYRVFSNWLFNSIPDAKLDDWVIKSINARTVLCMFGNLDRITIFINDLFNNYDVMYLDKLEFFNFLRVIVHKFNIKRKDISFYKHAKLDKSTAELQVQLPYLKKYEILDLLEYSKDDLEYDNFLEALGLNKKSRITKVKKSTKQKEKNSTNIITMKDWLNNFNLN